MPTTRLRVTLRDVHPVVSRVLDVPTSTTLPELHDLIQAAMGWTDSHLHCFSDGDRRWAVPHEDSWDDDELDETKAWLKGLPARFEYQYDFGDSWEHDIEVLGPGEQAGLVAGEGACPPEDCGGAPGYEQLLKVLADPSHPDHEHFAGWSARHSFVFDLDRMSRRVTQVLGAVPQPVQAMLVVVGRGLKLTQAGKLPPAAVAEMLERCPQWEPGIGAVREDNAPQVWMLKDLMREAGLLRLSRGILTPTKAATDEVEVIRRLRRRFPDGDFETLLITNALAVLAVAGPLDRDELMKRVLPMMGRHWAVNGKPLDEGALKDAWSWLRLPQIALDLVAGGFMQPEEAGPSGLTLLPRAALVAEWLREGAEG